MKKENLQYTNCDTYQIFMSNLENSKLEKILLYYLD